MYNIYQDVKWGDLERFCQISKEQDSKLASLIQLKAVVKGEMLDNMMKNILIDMR